MVGCKSRLFVGVKYTLKACRFCNYQTLKKVLSEDSVSIAEKPVRGTFRTVEHPSNMLIS